MGKCFGNPDEINSVFWKDLKTLSLYWFKGHVTGNENWQLLEKLSKYFNNLAPKTATVNHFRRCTCALLLLQVQHRYNTYLFYMVWYGATKSRNGLIWFDLQKCFAKLQNWTTIISVDITLFFLVCLSICIWLKFRPN